jgi:hypothetical protein
MNRVILDPALMNKLLNLSQPLELCDEKGKVRAQLIPVLDSSKFEPVEEPISEEELQRRRTEPGFSTAEVLSILENL